jgi:hypothetical protein
VLTLIAALCGTALGSVLAFVLEAQRSKRNREHRLELDRRTAYAAFLAAASIWANTVFAFYQSRRRDAPDRDDLWREVLRTHDKVLVPFFQLRLLGSPEVVAAAANLRRHIVEYERRAQLDAPEDPSFERDWNDEWPQHRDTVTKAARHELGISIEVGESFSTGLA